MVAALQLKPSSQPIAQCQFILTGGNALRATHGTLSSRHTWLVLLGAVLMACVFSLPGIALAAGLTAAKSPRSGISSTAPPIS